MERVSTKITQNNEFNVCSLSKLLCMFCVVIYHSVLYWHGGWFIGEPKKTSLFLDFISQWLNTFHIYTFTFVSGYLFYLNKYELQKYQNFKVYVFLRMKKLLIPYFFVSLIWVIPLSMPFYHWTAKDLMYNFLFMCKPSQLWFLPMLFWVSCVSYYLKDVFYYHGFISFFLLVALYFFGVVSSRIMPDFFQLQTALIFVLYYFLGFKTCQYKDNLLSRIPCYVYIVVDLLLFALLFFLKLPKLLRFVLIYFLHVLGCFRFFYVSSFFSRKQLEKKSINGLFEFFSGKTMEIYLFHQQIIYYIIFLLNGIIAPVFHGVINFFCSIFVSTLISILFSRNKYTKILIGKK